MVKGWVGEVDLEFYPENILIVFPKNPIPTDIPVTVLTAEEVGEIIKCLNGYKYFSSIKQALKVLKGE